MQQIGVLNKIYIILIYLDALVYVAQVMKLFAGVIS